MKFKNIEIKWLGHSGFLIIDSSGKKVYIDPYKISDLIGQDADIVLISHPHYDHCSLEDINKIVKDGTVIIGPADIQSKIARIDNKIDLRILDVGSGLTVENLKIMGVPAYNQDKEFHPKSERWLGYVIKFQDGGMGVVVYHAGDTDLIPEMSQLAGKVNLALLPIGGNFTMNAEESVKAVLLIKPELAIPMHYGAITGGESDAENFKNLCEKKGFRAEILEKW